jgi:endonuclease/exonuclease/phosphatase family metal-dependent hydrolase
VWARSSFGLRIVRRRPRRVDRPRVTARHDMELGTWGIAVLCRLPIRRTWTIELPQLHGDAARRGAVVVEVLLQGVDHAVPVVGTHLAHIRQGSPRHIAVLRRRLRAEGLGRVAARHGGGADERAGEGAGRGVLAGDMNMWGPPLVALLPGWSRVVRGRTWPTWLPRPVAQSDHVLVSGGIEGTGSVLRVGGSDHLPVRAELVI